MSDPSRIGVRRLLVTGASLYRRGVTLRGAATFHTPSDDMSAVAEGDDGVCFTTCDDATAVAAFCDGNGRHRRAVLHYTFGHGYWRYVPVEVFSARRARGRTDTSVSCTRLPSISLVPSGTVREAGPWDADLLHSKRVPGMAMTLGELAGVGGVKR